MKFCCKKLEWADRKLGGTLIGIYKNGGFEQSTLREYIKISYCPFCGKKIIKQKEKNGKAKTSIL